MHMPEMQDDQTKTTEQQPRVAKGAGRGQKVRGASASRPITLADVRGEIKQQLSNELAAIKLLLSSEIADAVLERVRSELTEELTTRVTQRVLATIGTDAATPVTPNAIIPVDVRRAADTVALVRAETQSAVATMGREVYRQVITEINERVVPQVDSMMQMVRYKMEDGTEVIDSYRRAVEHQSRAADGTLAITDGTIDKRVISPQVRLFFGGPDEDSDE